MTNIGFVGIGKIGMCFAACLATHNKVIVFDTDTDKISKLKNGIAPVKENLLQEIINENWKNLEVAEDIGVLLHKSDITFLCVQTPNTKKSGGFSNEYLVSALQNLSYKLKNKKKYHTFVIVSTVNPGSIESVLIKTIEESSEKKFNKDFGVVHVPEFIAIGTVINNFLNPDFIIIGHNNIKDFELIGDILFEMTNCKKIVQTSIVESEIAKIGINSYLTNKIAFANTLSNICENFTGANVDNVTRAMSFDSRISPFFFKGGMYAGGPCFPRDIKNFSFLCKFSGINPYLMQAVEKSNKDQINRLAKRILNISLDTKINKILILGTAYKNGVPLVVGSPSLDLIKKFLKKSKKVLAYDKNAIDDTKEYFKDKINYVYDIKKIEEKVIAVVMTREKEFEDLNFPIGSIIVDCWRIISKSNVKVIKLGTYNE